MINITLGETCDLVKGNIGIKKAVPGPYPLVVTAEERLSHKEYQFDAGAVCVPLVSSTGHGHASIKRIHYQEGKFALGSILVAIIPKQTSKLNTKYLYYYLSFYKDEILVPLMKGAANVSLTVDKLKTVKLTIPPIEEQTKLVKKIDKLNKLFDEMQTIVSTTKINIDQLIYTSLKSSFESN